MVTTLTKDDHCAEEMAAVMENDHSHHKVTVVKRMTVTFASDHV